MSREHRRSQPQTAARMIVRASGGTTVVSLEEQRERVEIREQELHAVRRWARREWARRVRLASTSTPWRRAEGE